jgi:3D-(3,5/4)-trihydroxycyclohexane-1,2-dione acylhydrolase (decyclizing)
LIIAGGGVIYSDATDALASFATRTGIPVAETQAGKGSLSYDHSQAVGAIGVTGTPGANILAREADLIIGVGTRYTDFTTASKTAFQNPDVRFININVAESDACKHAALPVVCDARVGIEELDKALEDYAIDKSYARRIQRFRDEWAAEVERIYNQRHGPPVSQAEVIGAVNEFTGPRDIVVCAAGSLPGDLHKLWRSRDPKGYHLEYGYSCMGYEIAGGLGVKMADPGHEVFVLVGDGSYLMMSQEIVTSIQEGYKLNIVVLDNHGFSSIGALSRSCGSGGFGTEYRYRRNGGLEGDVIELDLAANAASLGAWAVRARTRDDLVNALSEARGIDRTSVVVIETDINERVPGFESWWDVPIAEISKLESVQTARAAYEEAKRKERYFFQQRNETKVSEASVANRAERKRP